MYIKREKLFSTSLSHPLLLLGDEQSRWEKYCRAQGQPRKDSKEVKGPSKSNPELSGLFAAQQHWKSIHDIKTWAIGKGQEYPEKEQSDRHTVSEEEQCKGEEVSFDNRGGRIEEAKKEMQCAARQERSPVSGAHGPSHQH